MVLPVEPTVSSTKEKKEVLSRISLKKEKHPVVEKEVVPDIPPEIEKVEAVAGAEISLPQPVTDDTGAVVLDDASSQQVRVILPLTDQEMERALHLKLVESVRWLAEWSKRLLKRMGGKFVYRTSG